MSAIIVCYNYYSVLCEKRQHELDSCFDALLKNSSVTKILVIVDIACDFAQFKRKWLPHSRIHVLKQRERPTFSHWFKHIHDLGWSGGILVIQNSDIYVPPKTIELAKILLKQQPSTCFALTRHDTKSLHESDLKHAKLFVDTPHAGADSQDTWILSLPLFKNLHITCGNYHLGLWGCDNRIAYDLSQSGYKISNPAKKLITYHVHTVRITGPKTSSTKILPPYKKIPIT